MGFPRSRLEAPNDDPIALVAPRWPARPADTGLGEEGLAAAGAARPALWANIFGAACPARGTSAALVLPHANAHAFNLRLAEISKAVAKGAHAVVIIDGAGYHGAGQLKLPANLMLIRLPDPL